jgi:hypothetical protein
LSIIAAARDDPTMCERRIRRAEFPEYTIRVCVCEQFPYRRIVAAEERL